MLASSSDPRAKQILDIIAKETGVDLALLDLTARIDELGIASLDIVQTVFELEASLNIEIPVIADKPGAEFATIGELVAHVLATLDKRDRAAEAASDHPSAGAGPIH